MNLRFLSLVALVALSVGWCKCYFDKCDIRLRNQCCSCDFPPGVHLWAVFEHDSNRVLFSSSDRRYVVDRFFSLSTPSNNLDVVRFDLSRDFLDHSTIFVHK